MPTSWSRRCPPLACARSRLATQRLCTSSPARRRTRPSSTRGCRRSTSWPRGRRSAMRSTAARPFPASAEPRGRRHLPDHPGRHGGLPTVLSLHAQPDSNGIWTGPDLATAQKLVTASGTRGQKVVFWTGDLPFQRVIGEPRTRNAEGTRLSATLKILPSDDYWNHANDSRTGIQAGFFGWAPDYPAASNFMCPSHAAHSFRRTRITSTCRDLRPAHRPGCLQRSDPADDRRGRHAERRLGHRRSPGDEARSVGADREPSGCGGRLPSRRQRSVESAMGGADRSDVGQVTNRRDASLVGFVARTTSPGTGSPASSRNSAGTITGSRFAFARTRSRYPRAWQ